MKISKNDLQGHYIKQQAKQEIQQIEEVKNDKIIAYIRKYENQNILCINNFSDKKQQVELSEIAKSISEKEIKLADILINNYENIENDSEVLALEGYQSILVEFQIL